MDRIKTTEGDLVIRDGRFAIVAARFNDFIVESLIKGAIRCLRQHGAADADVEIFRVPGAYEMQIAIDKVATTRRFDGIVALGVIIRGGTPHFDYVAGECVRGISNASNKHNIPIGNGVLTVDTIEQAIERAGTKAGNKGEEATLAVIEMVNLLRRID
ncbi:MAG: 6,7-dimethyl-8-ribityllumazine synthase [Proteobacteria bacterium]|nr:6,7-dimethyl-8-ribityllumazine synthase [Pseudomonadota bacterium]MCH8099292.1 6,7-dimethyl-8-ribityllumazine synthase [Pseudomonadota bacterium]MCH8277510.1 6,7-dimethyl-8-ribityllumazine synthase [Pseudomonadota bacterium]MCH8945141.1 6,7-dimethyl-8-ribityllumazine synthase [Pseudomonadota bacterium]